MVLLINQRTAGYAGAIARAACWESAGGAVPTYAVVTDADLRGRTRDKQVIVAIHGFNVNRPDAVRSYAALEHELALTPDQVFFGVLWPGDGWIPVVNYPWESKDAMQCGAYLAQFLTAGMPHALSFNFISHSLGARVLLETLALLPMKAGEVCITAGAVDDDSLAKEFASVADRARRISLLTSVTDRVLLGAFPAGDFVADVFLGDKNSPWHGALGFFGPQPRPTRPPLFHRPIPKAPLGLLDPDAYDHGDYFPPSEPGGHRDLWRRSVAYMRRAINGEADAWP